MLDVISRYSTGNETLPHARCIASATVLLERQFFLSLLKCDDHCQHHFHLTKEMQISRKYQENANIKEMQISDFVKRAWFFGQNSNLMIISCCCFAEYGTEM